MDVKRVDGDCYVIDGPADRPCIDMPETRLLLLLLEGKPAIIWFSGQGHVHPVCEGPLFEGTIWPVVIMSLPPEDGYQLSEAPLEAAQMIRRGILEATTEAAGLAGIIDAIQRPDTVH